tara:strand:- start:6035 stop:7177 length:1143 start_codon:yes stop_codon:yes gene_type:complete
MDITIQKTITFILFICIGLLLKLKFKSKEEVNGIKKIILNLALPATIFIALLGIKVESNLLILPLLALALNFLIYYSSSFLLPLAGIEKKSPEYRTARLLVASLAPGLSCFPFVLEFLGEDYLAKAAMADLGNKIFVLIVLYIIAMNWYYKQRSIVKESNHSKIKSLLLALLYEPVNLFITIALILIFFGLSLNTLPFFITDTLSRLSVIMTPLVLLFIGLAVKIKRKDFLKLLSMLALRAGLVVLIIGIFVVIAQISVQNDILLLLSFGLSACSFWPFAHISAISSKEIDIPKRQQTFDTTFAVNILALSFPFSTILILGILSSGNSFSTAIPIFILATVLLVLGLIPFTIKKIIGVKISPYKHKIKWLRFKATTTENL